MVGTVPRLDVFDGLDGGKTETCLLKLLDMKVILGTSQGIL